jgi:ribosomal protein S18 acetylase RimI-like enzyme
MVTCIPADRLSPDERAALFNQCYADYFVPIALDPAALDRMAMLCDLDLGASRVREADGVRVGFAFLGVRGRRGWIGGMGVTPQRRRVGHGRALMNAVLDAARTLGITHVQLEVLEENDRARDLYVSLGFELTRRVNVWLRPAGSALPPAGHAASGIAFREPPARERLEVLAASAADPAPWQREVATLRHIESDLRSIESDAAPDDRAFVLYRAQEANVNIVELGSGAASSGALTALLRELAARQPAGWMRVLNLPEGHASERALRALGFEICERQREMKLALNRRT